MNIIIQDNERLDPKKSSFSHKFFKINPNNKKKHFSSSIFEKKEPWRPTYVINRYFEKFKKLNNEYEMNNWEIVKKIFYNIKNNIVQSK